MELRGGGATRRKRRPLRTAALALLLLALAALSLWLLPGGGGVRLAEDAFSTAAAGGDPCYDLAGDGLAEAANDGAQLFARDGSLLARCAFPMDKPACDGSENMSVFYDAGACDFCCLYADGRDALCRTQEPVVFADVNENGILAVTTESSGCRGRVTVYDADLTPLFQWDAGTGYPVSARVSRRDVLCVNCAAPAGSALRFFRTDSETELYSYTAPGELILDFGYLSDGTVAAVTSRRLILLGDNGTERASHELDGRYLAAFCLEGDFVSLVTSAYRSGGSAQVSTISSRGEVLGTLDTGREVSALFSAGDELLLLYPSEMTLYDEGLTDLVSYQRVEDVRQIFLRSDGAALLAGLGGADVIDLDR